MAEFKIVSQDIQAIKDSIQGRLAGILIDSGLCVEMREDGTYEVIEKPKVGSYPDYSLDLVDELVKNAFMDIF
jgi:hypothetical protein